MANFLYTIKRKLKKIKSFEILYSYIKSRLNNYNIIKKNFTEFISENNFIINDILPDSSEKLIMIVSQSDFIYSAKIELMLSYALKRRGWRVVYLVKRTSFWAIKFFKWSKIGEIVYFEDFYNNEIYNLAKIEAKKYLNQKSDFSSVREWRYKKSWIGPQILSTISRLQNQGMPDPEDKNGRKILENILPEIISSIEVSEKIIEKYKPNYCIVNEPNYDINGAMVDTLISKNIIVIHYTQPSKDDSLVFFKLTHQTRRIHPSTITKESFNKINNFLWNDDFEKKLQAEFANRYNGKYFLQSRNQPNITLFNKSEILNHLGIKNNNKKIVCIFSPVLWDANLFYGQDLFNDFEDWLIQTIKVAILNTNVIWLIKLHPANIWKLKRSKLNPENLSELNVINKHFGNLPSHIFILKPDCGISTLSLFNIIDVGITVRGTVGMELPCFGKLTLTAGTGRYSGLGFTNDSNTSDEYLKKINIIEDLPTMTEDEILLAKKHAYLSFHCRGWKMETYKSKFMKLDTGSHPLDHDLICNRVSSDFRDLE
jgi:hypothetical protein